jgi:hypothetical protein
MNDQSKQADVKVSEVVQQSRRAEPKKIRSCTTRTYCSVELVQFIVPDEIVIISAAMSNASPVEPVRVLD